MDTVFHRLDHDYLGLDASAIWMPLAALGGSVNAATFGFEFAGTRDPKSPLPKSLYAVDLHSPRQVLFVLAEPTGPPGEEPIVLIEADFPDPHPPAWEDLAHKRGLILILASERAFTAMPPREALALCWAAWAPLTIRMYPQGIGTSRPR